MRSLISHNIRRCSIIISPSSRHIISNSHHNIRNSSFSTAAKEHLVHVRSALSSAGVLLPYEKGWAWQHVLLHRRLKYMRRRMQQQQQQQQQLVDDITANTNNNVTQEEDEEEQHDNDHDCILLFEHEPVYTLGRGASEDHLTFLNNEVDGGVEKRKRLNRKYRGQDASRLNIDSNNNNQHSSSWQMTNNNNILSVEEEVSLLLKQCQCTSTNNNNTPPVYAPNGSPIYRIERGGEVTYHGPGQLVIYPLLNLKHPVYQQDLHWYLRQIEQVIIETLSHFNIPSNRDTINTGVWVDGHKIAAVGVSSSRWITTHGFAINVSPNLNAFDKDIMIPCGIDGRGVTSMENVLNNDDNNTVCPTVEEVGEVALHCFENVFGVTLVRHDDPIR